MRPVTNLTCFLFKILILFSTTIYLNPIYADTIAIIGTGKVAGALGPAFAKQGHTIIYGSRDPDRQSVKELLARTSPGASATTQAEAAMQADIIVLAVKWGVAEVVMKALGDLTGKIIIDPVNPLGRNDKGLAVMLVDSSAAEMIQTWAPGAYIVKAFNTLSYQVMAEPQSEGGPITIPIVGDNKSAKNTVSKLVSGMGLEAMDVGPLKYAHIIEGMLIVWINARVSGIPFNYYLRPVSSNK